MELVSGLAQLGLPGWLVSIAALVVILHYTGVIKLLADRMADQQEHSQSIELRHRAYEDLQQSWREDRISTLLEENESFIRERVWEELGKIRSEIRKQEMTIAQTRDTLASVYRALSDMSDRVSNKRKAE